MENIFFLFNPGQISGIFYVAGQYNKRDVWQLLTVLLFWDNQMKDYLLCVVLTENIFSWSIQVRSQEDFISLVRIISVKFDSFWFFYFFRDNQLKEFLMPCPDGKYFSPIQFRPDSRKIFGAGQDNKREVW